MWAARSLGGVSASHARAMIMVFMFFLGVGGTSAKADRLLVVSGSFGSVAAENANNRKLALEAVRSVRRDSRKYLMVSGVKFQFRDHDIAAQTKSLPIDVDAIPFSWKFPEGRDLSPEAEGVLIGLIRHELGHQVFLRRVLPPSQGGQYGSDAPDWLDESAAIVMESPRMKNDRRVLARLLARQNMLVPLSEFLVMRHPEAGKGAAQRLADVPNAIFMSSDPARTLAFYSQCQAFTDFLLSKTGETDILRQLADAVARQEDYVDVVRRNLGISKSEDSMHVLNARFLSWVEDEKVIDHSVQFTK